MIAPTFKPRRQGYALITVLLMVSLMAILIIGMFVLVKDDRVRARSYMEVGRSRFLTDMATQEVLAKIMDGSKVPWEDGKAIGSYTAAPGVIEMRKYKEPINKGYHRGRSSWSDPDAWARNPFAHEYERRSNGNWEPANPLTIPLYSRRWYAPAIRYMTAHNGNVSDGNPDYNPARVFNINTPNNPYAPGSLYISGSPNEAVLAKDLEADDAKDYNSGQIDDHPTRSEIEDLRFQPGEPAVDRPLNVQWIPIYKFAGKGNVYKDEQGRTRRNPVVGRYAYWVDVENTKVNINVADRKFVDSELSTILGETEALNPSASDRDFYFIQNPNVNERSASEAVVIRGKIEGTLMNASEWRRNQPPPAPPTTIIDAAKQGRGDNSAATTYFNTWMEWQEDGMPPYLADNSLIDWRVFTGLRPLAGGLGEDTTIEGLLADAAADTDKRFNTFGEVFSLLDPKTEEMNKERGLAALTSMQRTYGNSATIYGWDEERDPLGRPKIDIVKLLNGGVDGTLFNDLLNRLKDPDYYLAYQTGADASGDKSFVSGLNPLVGDNDPSNNSNGEAAARQMLVNIIEYGKPHSEAPYINEGQGIVGAKSMPYVMEVATRARNGMWRIYKPTKNAEGQVSDPAFDAMARDFAQKVSELRAAVTNREPVGEIDRKLQEVLNYADPAGTFTSRQNGKSVEDFLTGVMVDLTAAMVNPNPFAEERGSADRRNNYFSGSLELNYDWHGVSPIDPPGEKKQSFDGLYVARSIPLRKERDRAQGGIRVDGESVYFDLGMVSGETVLGNEADPTALRIEGWEISRNGLFHKVPIRHPGQSSSARPWWAMAQPEANPGMITNGNGGYRNTIDYFSLAHFYQPFNIEHSGGKPWQWHIPNVPINPVTKISNSTISAFPYQDWKNVSVGWFTARTIAEKCRSYGEEVVAQGPSGFLYLSEDAWQSLTSEWNTIRSGPAANQAAFLAPNGNFARAVNTLHLIARSLNDRIPAMVERVTAIDPTLGHRTGNPDAYQRGSAIFPDGLAESNVGHFYGTNGHPWRLAPIPPGPPLENQTPPEPENPGTPRRVPIYQDVYEDQEVTYRTPVGNTYVTTSKTIRVKTGKEVVGYRTVYDHAPRPSSRGRGPVHQGNNLTDSFANPLVTSVPQGDLLGEILQHHPLNNGWETECIPGGGGRGWRSKPTIGQARYGAPAWAGFFCSAPKGDLMTSIGEIGFCHSGLLGRAIELNQKQTNCHIYPSPPGWWDYNVPYLGSPKHGLPPSMLLDLLTPGAFRDNSTGERYSEAEWRNSRGTNTPDSPRRGTWNINALPASDTYMAMREGFAGGRSERLGSIPTHPVWAPNGHAMAAGLGIDHKWLDPMMNPFPRYRRGFESWIAIMVGDYTPFRSRGEAIWGRMEPQSINAGGVTTAIRPGAYALLSAPVFSWRSGLGGAADPDEQVIPFDSEIGGAQSSLLSMGFISSAGHQHPRRYSTRNEAAGLYYIDRGYDVSKPRDPTLSLAEMARTGNFPLRHHNSELISVSSQPINDLHTALNPKQSSVGWAKVGGFWPPIRDRTYGFLGKYSSYFQPYQNFAGSRTVNGHPGAFAGTGIYANAPVVLSANQVSTAANVFTAHIVTQAVRDNGKEREDFSIPPENTNTGLGFMDHDDEVLGEQWTQVVIARIPGDGRDPETGGPNYDYRILYSRTLDHQAQ